MADPRLITGLILAGGKGRRMGGVDKGLVLFRGRPLVEHVIERFSPQVGSLLISANRHLDRYAHYGHPVIADARPGFAGPLAGLAAGLSAAVTPWLAMVPCDSPFLPLDLVERLAEAAEEKQAPLAYAKSAEGAQPTFLFVARRLAPALHDFLAQGGRGVFQWCRAMGAAEAFFPDAAAFANLNRPEDLG